MLADFLAEEELGTLYSTDPDYPLIQEAVEEATITVFPNYYKDGDQILVAWSEDYHHLPNRFERFKKKKGKGIIRLIDTGRRKYWKTK